MNLEERIKILEDKIGKLNYPIDSNSQGSIESVLFKILKAQSFKGGFPIFTANRVDQRNQSETYVYNISGSPQIAIYINGVEYTFTAD